jgi:hypothetical protein
MRKASFEDGDDGVSAGLRQSIRLTTDGVSRTNGGKNERGTRRHKELISDKLDFGNWIPNDYVFVLFETGDCNGRDRHLRR